MKLPNALHLVVERGKIVDYLLNSQHRYGASKARFLGVFGFRSSDWETLAEALRRHGQTHEVARRWETAFGTRFEVHRHVTAPDGRHPCLCTVWQLDEGEIAPRLITAYPLEREYD